MSSLTPVSVFTDAAGGDASKIKNGIGSFAPPGDWCYMPWPQLIRENRENTDGVKFAHKLCTLEGFAALCGHVGQPLITSGLVLHIIDCTPSKHQDKDIYN